METNSVMARRATNFITGILFLTLLSSGLAMGQSAGHQSLYQDVKANRIGDVITVILKENISGTSDTDSRSHSATSGSADASLSGNLNNFLPMFGGSSSVNYNSDDQNRASSRQLLRGHVSVRVEDITPSGDLFVIGKRSTEINGELHTMEIEGFIRPSDVDQQNMIPSYRVANADITYHKDESLKQASRRPGFRTRVVWISLGALVTGTAIYQSVF